MIPIIQQTGRHVYEQIYEFYRVAIIDGRLAYKDRLPSHRVLAKELGIGNNTVIRAYEQLIHEGYVRNERRKGLFVNNLDSRDGHVMPISKKPKPENPTEVGNKRKLIFDPANRLVDEKNFPIKQWRTCSNWALDQFSFQYEEHEGHDQLKDELVKYLFKFRGVNTSATRIIIGSGVNALLFWLAFVLRKTHSEIIFEEPCYPRARSFFSEFGYKIKTVTVNNEGVDLQKLSIQTADLIYLTPSHQYPTGAAIPVGNRIQILNWAEKNNAYIIEDDFDCEFRYKTKLMPSLQGLDKSGRVIYVGSFSNSLMPSLRVAYLVLPENFAIAYQSFAYLTNTVPYVVRKTLANFMERGFWERHLRRMRNIYLHKYQACIEALQKLPAKRIYFNHTPSGLNILLSVNSSLSEQALVKKALDSGIGLAPVSAFYYKRRRQTKLPEILFEFGSLPLEQIANVVQKLNETWFM